MSAVGHVYFLRQGAFVKIGHSTNYRKRCAAISAYTPEETVIVAAHPGTQSDEVQFHKLLLAYHHRLEWFRWCPEVEAMAASGLPPKPVVLPLSGAATFEMVRKTFGDAVIAKSINVTRQAVVQWKRVPLGRVHVFEKTLGVPREELRPDYFGEGAA